MANNNFVGYMIMPRRSGSNLLFSNQGAQAQEKKLQDFIHNHPGATLIKIFVESSEPHRNRNRWPELEKAVATCLEIGADLVIGEIRNLTNNETFTKHILHLIEEKPKKADGTAHYCAELHCCDQHFINKNNFAALVEYAKKQRQLHGELIKLGLSKTTAKSGNPHAADVITKVNKPKIDNAITFALLLQPVITQYQLKGYSQRKMVNALNEEGFTAPEGGHWVLSQLQKVLDRIKMNEAALNLEKRFLEYRAKQMDDTEISEALNKLGIPSPQGSNWSSEVVEKVTERVGQIHDILRFNEFVIELMPILEKYHIDELTDEIFAQELHAIGIEIPQHISVQ